MSETWELFALTPLNPTPGPTSQTKKKKLASKSPLSKWKTNIGQSTLHTKHDFKPPPSPTCKNRREAPSLHDFSLVAWKFDQLPFQRTLYLFLTGSQVSQLTWWIHGKLHTKKAPKKGREMLCRNLNLKKNRRFWDLKYCFGIRETFFISYI